MDTPEGYYPFGDSLECKARRLEAESNLHYLQALIENVKLGSDGDAATLRIMLAKVAGRLPVADILMMAGAMLDIATREAGERIGDGEKPPVLGAAGVAEQIYQPKAPGEQFAA